MWTYPDEICRFGAIDKTHAEIVRMQKFHVVVVGL
jgi:hypothetical protein